MVNQSWQAHTLTVVVVLAARSVDVLAKCGAGRAGEWSLHLGHRLPRVQEWVVAFDSVQSRSTIVPVPAMKRKMKRKRDTTNEKQSKKY